MKKIVKKSLVILVAMVCFGLSANAENGNFCNGKNRIELYNDGTFQMAVAGQFCSGTYKIESGLITFYDKNTGESLKGRYSPGVNSRSGVPISPPSIDLLGVKLEKGKC